MVFKDPQQAAKWMEMEALMDSSKEMTNEKPTTDTLLYEWAKTKYIQYRESPFAEEMNEICTIYSELIDKQLFFNGRIFYNRMLVYIQQKKYRAALTDLTMFSAMNKEFIVNDPSVAAFLYYKLDRLDSACLAYQNAEYYKKEYDVNYYDQFHLLDTICVSR